MINTFSTDFISVFHTTSSDVTCNVTVFLLNMIECWLCSHYIDVKPTISYNYETAMSPHVKCLAFEELFIFKNLVRQKDVK